MAVSTRITLPSFKIIACVDSEFGIGKNGAIPWHNPDDLRWFAGKTANSVIIMGRKTHESIGRVLSNRINIIISSTMDGREQPNNLYVVETLIDALTIAAGFHKNVYVVGGGKVYQEAIVHPLCCELIITHLPDSYDCDVMFPQIPIGAYDDIVAHRHPDHTLHIKLYRRTNKSESAYLDLLRRVLAAPQISNRTGVSTYSLFGEMIKYPLRDESGRAIIPLFTTKFVPFRIVYEELLWFLRGSTNTDYLKLKNVNIWDANSTTEFLDSVDLSHYREGELGPVYGHQWRRFNAPYTPETDLAPRRYSTEHTDQIAELIDGLKTNPLSRRHVVSAWNPQQLKEMALPPCHLMFIFNVQEVVDGDSGDSGDNYVADADNTTPPKYLLNCHLTMRSNDLFLGHPFNVASYAALTHMIAKICDMVPGELAISITNAHIYANHVDAVKEQLTHEPYGYPQVMFSEKIEDLYRKGELTIDSFESDDVSVSDYHHHGRITASMVA